MENCACPTAKNGHTKDTQKKRQLKNEKAQRAYVFFAVGKSSCYYEIKVGEEENRITHGSSTSHLGRLATAIRAALQLATFSLWSL